MIELRRAETDDDLEAWIQVRRAVLPKESAGAVDHMRAAAKPGRLLLLAELDGALAGSALANRAETGDRIYPAPRLLPDWRRRGWGRPCCSSSLRMPNGSRTRRRRWSRMTALRAAAAAVKTHAAASV